MITIAEYARFANKSVPLDNETQIEALIDVATEIMEREIDRDLYACSPSPLDVVETFNGRGSFRVWTKQAPIDDVTTVEYWTGTEWQDVSELNMTFEFDSTTGKIWFTERYVFHEGVDNWRITYSYGFTEGIPEDLKYACYLLTKHLIDHPNRQGIMSQSDGEQSFTYGSDENLPKRYVDILANYKRWY